MFVKFKDGTTQNCSNPTEQKLFKSGEAAGWLCAFVVSGIMNSTDVDSVLTADNISNLEFCNDEGTKLFEISGYTKVTSVVVRYTETSGSVEIQLTKGV